MSLWIYHIAKILNRRFLSTYSWQILNMQIHNGCKIMYLQDATILFLSHKFFWWYKSVQSKTSKNKDYKFWRDIIDFFS